MSKYREIVSTVNKTDSEIIRESKGDKTKMVRALIDRDKNATVKDFIKFKEKNYVD